MDASNQLLKLLGRGNTAVIALLFAHTLVWSASPTSKQPAFAPDTVLVAFQPGTTGAEMSATHSQAGGKVRRTLAASGVHVVGVPTGTVLDKLKLYRRNPNVRYAEPNYFRPLIIPTEGSFSSTIDVFDEQWNLHNQGQSLQTYADPATGLPGWQYTRQDADIDAPEAWDVEKGSANVWVAVPDSGVACTHGDLVGKCQHNEDYVTATLDLFGNPIPELIDRLGHGTHVAGTIAMQTNNGAGGAGVGWNTSIGSFKVCYAEMLIEDIVIGSTCADADIVAAIDRIIELGYDIINMSFGGPASQAVEEALNRASLAGIVLVAAAGNNNNWEKFYPAAYDNVIAVGASNAFDDRAGFSTFSVDDDFDPSTQNDDWVDVLAPGDPVLGPVPSSFCGGSPQCFGWKSGSSMAAPHVSGVAALVLNYLTVNDPANANSTEVRRRIQDCADATGAMGQNMLAWSKYGRLNAHGAITCGGAGNIPPSANFAFVPADLNVAFTDQSTDADGTVMSWDWNFGDGNNSGVQDPNYTYAAAGTYSVTLTVMDDDGATDQIPQNVTVTGPPGGITLTADGYKVKGLQKVDLTWTGASGNVDVYRDGSEIAPNVNGSAYTDNINQRGGGSYTYKVCEAGISTCSNEVTVIF